jgi:chorismate mutase
MDKNSTTNGTPPLGTQTGTQKLSPRRQCDPRCVLSALGHMLAERFRYTEAIGKLKARRGLPSQDPQRETEQVSRLRTLAAAPANSTQDLLRSFSPSLVMKSYGIMSQFSRTPDDSSSVLFDSPGLEASHVVEVTQRLPGQRLDRVDTDHRGALPRLQRVRAISPRHHRRRLPRSQWLRSEMLAG